MRICQESGISPLILILVFSILSESAVAQSQSDSTSYKYDALGNVTSIVDGMGNAANNKFDSLGRLIEITRESNSSDSLPQKTTFQYNSLDQLLSVKDPRNLVTSYVIDGLGNQTAIISPDSGSVKKTFDVAGRILTSLDAKGLLTSYQYDSIDRLVLINYADGTSTAFKYDSGENSIGRLATVIDGSDSINYRYDIHGRVISETHTVDANVYSTQYAYDKSGQLESMTYPSGRIVRYLRNAIGNIQEINTEFKGTVRNLIRDVRYHPFAGVKSFINGAGVQVSRDVDMAGRPVGYSLASSYHSITYDTASRINEISEKRDPSKSQRYLHDGLGRLVNYFGSGPAQTVKYDASSNRISRTIGTSESRYIYENSSNMISRINGGFNQEISHDASGNIISRSFGTLDYDARGRLIRVNTSAGSTEYKNNALGQRVTKKTNGGTTFFNYDIAGRLISEFGSLGNVEYVFLDDLPIAMFR